jgi:hypothetical protein
MRRYVSGMVIGRNISTRIYAVKAVGTMDVCLAAQHVPAHRPPSQRIYDCQRIAARIALVDAWSVGNAVSCDINGCRFIKSRYEFNP